MKTNTTATEKRIATFAREVAHAARRLRKAGDFAGADALVLAAAAQVEQLR